jgi:hypothetical protein
MLRLSELYINSTAKTNCPTAHKMHFVVTRISAKHKKSQMNGLLCGISRFRTPTHPSSFVWQLSLASLVNLRFLPLWQFMSPRNRITSVEGQCAHPEERITELQAEPLHDLPSRYFYGMWAAGMFRCSTGSVPFYACPLQWTLQLISLRWSMSRPGLGPTQPPVQWLPGEKRPGSEADHSPPSSAEVKNAWTNTYTPPILLHGVVLN